MGQRSSGVVENRSDSGGSGQSGCAEEKVRDHYMQKLSGVSFRDSLSLNSVPARYIGVGVKLDKKYSFVLYIAQDTLLSRITSQQ